MFAPVDLEGNLNGSELVPSFIVRPIGRDITSEVRDSMRAPRYGHPVHRELARGTGPCRECLSTFTVGEDDRLLFTHDAFVGSGLTPQPGPVFIHADQCEPYSANGYPDGLKPLPVLAQAHRADGTRAAALPLRAGEEDSQLAALLDDDDVLFLHLRHAEAGCFIALVERQAPSTTRTA